MPRLTAVLAVVLGAVPILGQQPGPDGKTAAPKFLDDEGKDIFNDLESEDKPHGDYACELREKLLKKLAGQDDREAGDHRIRVLIGLGVCEFRKGEYAKSKQRLESAVSDMNAPNEDVLLQNPQVAHVPLLKQAAGFMSKREITQAGTALRRCREIMDRNLKKVLKTLHKQMSQAGQAPPLEAIIEELPGFGKTGQYMPMVLKQVPMLKSELSFAEVVDNSLDVLDKKLSAIDKSLKDKKIRMDVSKGKSKGSLLYVRALPAVEAVVPAAQSTAAQELATAADALAEETKELQKSTTLLKRTKDDKGCKDGKGLEKTCAAVKKVADVASNGFGDTRVLVVKAGKKQTLDTCTTNANIGILLAARDGVSLTVKGSAGQTELKAGEPVVFDFCREASLEATAAVPVLFAQAWHPEFAAVERSTELRQRSSAFSLSEEEVKAAVKIVNDAAKKGWEKTSNLWRKDSEGHKAITTALVGEEEAKKNAVELAAEAKLKEDAAGDEVHEKNLQELEKKREAKRLAAEAAEQKRLKRKQQLEEERLQRDPWLNDPAVVEVEKKIEELKEARRDANAKLEFDLSTQLTKEVSAAERNYKKVLKQAKKAHKKGTTVTGAAKDKEGKKEVAEEEDSSGSSELKDLRQKLKTVTQKKNDAADAENFKEAKKLKAEQKALEDQIKKLEL